MMCFRVWHGDSRFRIWSVRFDHRCRGTGGWLIPMRTGVDSLLPVAAGRGRAVALGWAEGGLPLIAPATGVFAPKAGRISSCCLALGSSLTADLTGLVVCSNARFRASFLSVHP